MNRQQRRKMMRNKKYRKLVNNEAEKAVNAIEAAILKKNQQVSLNELLERLKLKKQENSNDN